MKKSGFTLIELIVLMAILAILILLATPKYKEYTKEAHLTKIKVNVKELENASNKYYMTYNDWPRLSDTPYTAEQIEDFGKEILDKTGQVVVLEEDGNYYDIDYNKIDNYIKIHDDGIRYILQNPVGRVFYIEGITEEAKTRLEDLSEKEEEVVEKEPVYTPLKQYTTNTAFSFTTWAQTNANHKIIDTTILNNNNKYIYIDYPQFIIGQPFFCQYYIEIKNVENSVIVGWYLNNGSGPGNFKYLYLNNTSYTINDKMASAVKIIVGKNSIKYTFSDGREQIIDIPFDIITGDVVIRERINYWYTPNKVPAGATIGIIE